MMTSLNNKLIVILGATGTAKTRIAKLLALDINGALINCDSSQIYKELNIGNNKTQFNDFNNPHYLFSTQNPDINYSIENYQKDSREAINKCWKSGYTPILVGGSVLYALSCISDFKYSKERSGHLQLSHLSNKALHEILSIIDPEEAHKTHYNNRPRVIRALEIFHNEGINKTEFNKFQNKDYFYKNIYIFGLNVERDTIKEFLKKRIEQQFEDGLVEEVKQLIQKYPKTSLSMQAIGYKEIINGLDQNKTIEEIKEAIWKNTYKYAKHQIKFLKKIKKITFIDVDFNNLNEAKNSIKYYLTTNKFDV